MATDALADGFDELMWIDSDVAFHPDDVDKLRNHKLPFVCGIYAKKGPREVAAAVLPGTTQLQFGFDGGLGRQFNCEADAKSPHRDPRTAGTTARSENPKVVRQPTIGRSAVFQIVATCSEICAHGRMCHALASS